MQGTYVAPNVPDDQVTPQLVRDELLKCFESANGEFAKLMRQEVAEAQLKEQVRGFVQGVFNQCGVSFVEPTKEGIVTAISQCKSNAEGMMGPQATEIIEHHYTEMMKLVDRL
jgi:hypothetical protein